MLKRQKVGDVEHAPSPNIALDSETSEEFEEVATKDIKKVINELKTNLGKVKKCLDQLSADKDKSVKDIVTKAQVDRATTRIFKKWKRIASEKKAYSPGTAKKVRDAKEADHSKKIRSEVKKTLSAGSCGGKKTPSPLRRFQSDITETKLRGYLAIPDKDLRNKVFQKLAPLKFNLLPSTKYKICKDFTLLTPDELLVPVKSEPEVSKSEEQKRSTTPKRQRSRSPCVAEAEVEIETLSTEIESEAVELETHRKVPVGKKTSMPNLMGLVENELWEIRKENPSSWTQMLSRLRRIYNIRGKSEDGHFIELARTSEEYRNPYAYEEQEYQFILRSAAGEWLYLIGDSLINALEQEDADFQDRVVTTRSLYEWRLLFAEDILFLTVQLFDYEVDCHFYPSFEILEACVGDAENFEGGDIPPDPEDSLEGLGHIAESVHIDEAAAAAAAAAAHVPEMKVIEAEIHEASEKGKSSGPRVSPRFKKKSEASNGSGH